jgi:uncharacterized protein
MSNSRHFKRAAKPKKSRTITLEQLEDWLADRDPPAPGVSMIDGYLAALIVSPEFVPPAIWLCPIVGKDVRDAEDATLEGAVRNTLFERYNQISSTLSGGPKRYSPIFLRTDDGELLPEDYANGFWFGMQMTLDKWNPFISDPAIGMPLTAIFGHCTTMTGDDERLAAIDGPGTEALAESGASSTRSSKCYTPRSPVPATSRSPDPANAGSRPSTTVGCSYRLRHFPSAA